MADFFHSRVIAKNDIRIECRYAKMPTLIFPSFIVDEQCKRVWDDYPGREYGHFN